MKSIIGILSFILLIVSVILYFAKSKSDQVVQKQEMIKTDDIQAILFELRVEHPDIVFSQIILESDSLRSRITKENNNITGMKMPAQRPTTAISIKNGYCVYKSIRECLIDYALYQQIYLRHLPRDELLNKLQSDYAQDPNYKQKLIKIIYEKNL